MRIGATPERPIAIEGVSIDAPHDVDNPTIPQCGDYHAVIWLTHVIARLNWQGVL